MFEDTLETVCRVLNDQTGSEVQPDVSLADLGLDSLDVVEVVLNLEEAFPEISLDDYEPAETVTALELAEKIVDLKVGK